MLGNRSKNAKRNIVSGLINKVLTIMLPFLIRTILIRELGAEYLGLSGLFTAILQVLNMSELGFSSAIVFSLYKPMAEDNKDEICSLLAFYRFVYKFVGCVILLLGLCILPFLKFFINGSYPNDINIYVLYIIYLANTVVSYFCFAYKNALFTAGQRQDVISSVDSILVFTRYGIQIIALLLTRNYYVYIIWNLIFTLINNFVIAGLARKFYPNYICKGKLSTSQKNKVKKQIGGLAIGKLSQVTRNSFDSVVLSMFCGLLDVAIYSNYFYIYTAISGFLSVVIQALTAGVGNSMTTEVAEKNYYDFKRFNVVFNMIFGVCTVCLFCLYQPFMRLWVGNELTAHNIVMYLFCIYFYISQMGQIRGMYATASGLWWEFRFISIAEMFFNLLLNFLLGYLWGMPGILTATIVSVTVFSLIPVTKITLKKCFSRSGFEYWRDAISFILITILGAFFVNKIVNIIQGETFTIFILKGGITLVLAVMIFISFVLLVKPYRIYLISVMNNVVGRNK